jgi:hypothetical protein
VRHCNLQVGVQSPDSRRRFDIVSPRRDKSKYHPLSAESAGEALRPAAELIARRRRFVGAAIASAVTRAENEMAARRVPFSPCGRRSRRSRQMRGDRAEPDGFVELRRARPVERTPNRCVRVKSSSTAQAERSRLAPLDLPSSPSLHSGPSPARGEQVTPQSRAPQAVTREGYARPLDCFVARAPRNDGRWRRRPVLRRLLRREWKCFQWFRGGRAKRKRFSQAKFSASQAKLSLRWRRRSSLGGAQI